MSIQSALIVGTGLIGASVALALRQHDVEVALSDVHPDSVEAASACGAGVPHQEGQRYDLAVVAVPPSSTIKVVEWIIEDDIATLVTDVASTKEQIARQAIEVGIESTRFVPSHPMAGREIMGPEAALPDLFQDKAWAITQLPDTPEDMVQKVEWLVRACGATPVHIDPISHDQAVAAVSHVPHLVSSMLARTLLGDGSALRLAGTGLPGMVRLAGGDPGLWSDILAGNAENVRERLVMFRDMVDETLYALDTSDESTPSNLREQLRRGQQGKNLLDNVIEQR